MALTNYAWFRERGQNGDTRPVLKENISPDAHTIYTDESAAYAIYLQRTSMPSTRPSTTAGTTAWWHAHEYDRDAFSLLKRGVNGTFHKVSIKHLGRYCNESSLDLIAAGAMQMFDATLKSILKEMALPYKKLRLR